MQVVNKGWQFHQHKVEAGLPQGSALGPLLWNIYISDPLNLVLSAKAYSDDITISVAFTQGEETVLTFCLNATLKRLEAWRHRWQVSFAAQKTQLPEISRTASVIHIHFNRTVLKPQQELKVLDVTYGSKLSYKLHLRQLARTAAGKLASLRRKS